MLQRESQQHWQKVQSGQGFFCRVFLYIIIFYTLSPYSQSVLQACSLHVILIIARHDRRLLSVPEEIIRLCLLRRKGETIWNNRGSFRRM
jgi:hypothetical protein